MENKITLSLGLVNEHISKIEDSSLPNPLYGKATYFFRNVSYLKQKGINYLDILEHLLELHMS